MHSVDIENRRITTRDIASTSHKWWTLAAVCTGVFMLLLDVTIVNVALPDIERGVPRLTVGPAVGDRRLRADPGRFPAHGGIARGSLRAADPVRRRDHDLHARVARLRARDEFAVPGRRARRARGRRGDHVRDLARVARPDVPRQGSRRRVRRCSGRSPGSPSRSARSSAARSPAARAWRWIFYVNIPIGVLALLVTLLRVDESRDPNATRPDWVGFATFSAGLAALVFGLIRSNADGWGSATVRRLAGRRAPCCSPRSSIAERVQSRADARPAPAPRPDLQRRPGSRLGDLGVDLLGPHLPDPLPPEHPGPVRRRDRHPLPAAHRRDLPHRRDRGPADRARAPPAADRRRGSCSSASECCSCAASRPRPAGRTCWPG